MLQENIFFLIKHFATSKNNVFENTVVKYQDLPEHNSRIVDPHFVNNSAIVSPVIFLTHNIKGMICFKSNLHIILAVLRQRVSRVAGPISAA